MQEELHDVEKQVRLMPERHKRTKGVPELHDELKKRVNLSLTPTAIGGLDFMAAELGISRSELVEWIGRRKILLATQNDLGNVDAEVYAFVEKAIRDLPPIDTSRSLVKVVLFKERYNVPNTPGVYVLSDWRTCIPSTTQDLRAEFYSDQFMSISKKFLDDYENQGFILWQTFQDSRMLADFDLAAREVIDVYYRLKKKVIARGLQQSVSQMRTDVKNTEDSSS